MRAVIQRVSAADVVVNGGAPRAIGRGLMILLGVRDTDTRYEKGQETQFHRRGKAAAFGGGV